MKRLIWIAGIVFFLVWLAGRHNSELEKAAQENAAAAKASLTPAPPPKPLTDAERVSQARDLEKRWREALAQDYDPISAAQVAQAIGELKRIPATAPEAKEAKALIGKLDEDQKRADAAIAKRDAKAKLSARKQLAETLQHEFLMRNMDARFTAEGASATTLRMKYVLVGMPLAEQLKTDGKFIERCRDVGFKRLVLDDTFGKTWTFNLE